MCVCLSAKIMLTYSYTCKSESESESVQLQNIVKNLPCQSYLKAILHQLQVGFIDNQSNIICFFKD